MTITDQMGNQISVEAPFQRVISLVPSQTELLVDLIGADRVIGRTKFCIYPTQKVKQIQVVGGTKNFNFDKIAALNPDLIIGNKEENYREGIERLQEDYPVWMSDINDLEDSYEMITSLGALLGVADRADSLVENVKESMGAIKGKREGKVLYFIWQNPFIVAGKCTFIDFMLRFLGFSNTCIQMRYPEMDDYVLENLDPDYVFLSSEPFPFKQHHIHTFQALFPKAKVSLVDGEMFSWYGSRLLEAGKYFDGEFLSYDKP